MRIDSDGIFEFAAMASIAVIVTTIMVLMLFIVLSIASSRCSTAKRRNECKAQAERRQKEAHEKRQRKAMKRLDNLTKAVRDHGA